MLLNLNTKQPLSAEEKKERDNAYRVEVKEFYKILVDLVKNYTALNQLTTALASIGKGSYLAFPNPGSPGTFIPFHRKHLKSAQGKFAKRILDLRNYLRVARKKSKEPVDPSSLAGIYAPVYGGQALRYFFTAKPENFGPLQPLEATKTGATTEALMDSLDLAKQGYFLRNTGTMLFFIYAHVNQLQGQADASYAKVDDVMNAAFNGTIPAAFYRYREDGSTSKVTMDRAIELGLVPEGGLNTFQVIKRIHADFNTTRFADDPDNTYFKTYFYQNMAALNYYSKSALMLDDNFKVVADAIKTKEVSDSMLNEHSIVKEASKQWRAYLAPYRRELTLQRNRNKAAEDKAGKGKGKGRARK